MRRILLVALIGAFALGALGLGQEIGTREKPIIWLLPPSVLPAVIEEISKEIAKDLYEMTGLFIKPVVMPSYAALVEAMIAAKGDTMACPTTEQYAAITNVNPGVHARLAAVRYGYHYYFSTIYVPREAGYTSLYEMPEPAFRNKRRG